MTSPYKYNDDKDTGLHTIRAPERKHPDAVEWKKCCGVCACRKSKGFDIVLVGGTTLRADGKDADIPKEIIRAFRSVAGTGFNYGDLTWELSKEVDHGQ